VRRAMAGLMFLSAALVTKSAFAAWQADDAALFAVGGIALFAVAAAIHFRTGQLQERARAAEVQKTTLNARLRLEAELKAANRSLSAIETQFMQHLDLLKRDVLSEGEFIKANEGLRTQKVELEGRKADLDAWLKQQQGRASAAERMPVAIRSFVEDFGRLDVRVQKARLQEILKAVVVGKDTLEVEFRA